MTEAGVNWEDDLRNSIVANITLCALVDNAGRTTNATKLIRFFRVMSHEMTHTGRRPTQILSLCHSIHRKICSYTFKPSRSRGVVSAVVKSCTHMTPRLLKGRLKVHLCTPNNHLPQSLTTGFIGRANAAIKDVVKIQRLLL